MFTVLPPAIADLTNLEILNLFNNHVEVNIFFFYLRETKFSVFLTGGWLYLKRGQQL